jgi:hypothetical protein
LAVIGVAVGVITALGLSMISGNDRLTHTEALNANFKSASEAGKSELDATKSELESSKAKCAALQQKLDEQTNLLASANKLREDADKQREQVKRTLDELGPKNARELFESEKSRKLLLSQNEAVKDRQQNVDAQAEDIGTARGGDSRLNGSNSGVIQGSQFKYAQVAFSKSAIGALVIGEIENGSGKTWKIATFQIAFYDDADRLLGTTPLIISSFQPGMKKAFSENVLVPVNTNTRFKITYENGIE